MALGMAIVRLELEEWALQNRSHHSLDAGCLAVCVVCAVPFGERQQLVLLMVLQIPA